MLEVSQGQPTYIKAYELDYISAREKKKLKKKNKKNRSLLSAA